MTRRRHLDAVVSLEAPMQIADNSPGRHATAHHHDGGHPIVRSVEPGEDWSW